jgi:hypothetical protein
VRGWPISLTTRLALLFALLTAILLVVVVLVQGSAVEGHLRELDDQELTGKVTLIKNLLHRAELSANSAARRLDDAFIGHDALGVVLRDAEGTVVYAHPPGVLRRTTSWTMTQLLDVTRRFGRKVASNTLGCKPPLRRSISGRNRHACER